MLAPLAARFERLLSGAEAIVIAVALARVLKWSVHRLEQRRPGGERELLRLRRRETAIEGLLVGPLKGQVRSDALLADPIVYALDEGTLSRYERRVLVS